jgi:DNA polymerase-3 subunit gamma/tau
MGYLSLYRRYRSQRFEELAGQEHVTRALRNAVAGGKVAHAYLFSGPRGTGKTSTARLLAKALNCEVGPTPDPCNACRACLEIAAGSFLDLHELDAASNRGIDPIRDLRDNVAFAPVSGRAKVYVIDEAHQLTLDAFNALLKTLEEPPAFVVFVLATTEAYRIPATIVSRCQRFEFRRASEAQLRERIAAVACAEGAAVEPAAAALLARAANGGWRDALSLLEQVLAFAEGPVTPQDVYTVLGTVEGEVLARLADAVNSGDGAALFSHVDELVAAGKDPRQLISDLAEHYRQLLLVASGRAPVGDEAYVQAVLQQSAAQGQQRLVDALELLAQVEREARWSEQPRLLLELALFRLMYPRKHVDQPGAAELDGRKEARSGARLERETSPAGATAARGVAAREERARQAGARAPVARERDPARPTGGADALAEASSAPGSSGDAASGSEATPPSGAELPRLEAPDEQLESTAEGDERSGLLALLQQKWRLVGEELKRARRPLVQAMLADTLPSRFEEDQLVISFPSATLAEVFTGKGSQFTDPLAEAVHAVVGIRCRFRAEVAGGGSGAPPARQNRPAVARRNNNASPGAAPASPAPQVPRSSPPGGDLVHEVLDVFGGTLLEERDLE